MRWRLLSFLLIFPTISIHADNILPGQVINYSDFSYISSIAVGFDYVYFGSTNGITRYNVKTTRWADPMTGIEGLEGGNVREIRVSRDDQTVWARTEIGYFEYNETFGYWSPIDTFPNEQVFGHHIQPDPTYIPPPGYNYMSSGALVDQNGKRFPLTDVVDDGWSNLWIGTWGLGAMHADISIQRLEVLNYGLIQEDVSAICADSGTLWMGGESRDYYRTGITSFVWRNNDFDYIETEGTFVSTAPNIYDIATDDNRIYAATDNGVWVIDKKGMKIADQLRRSSGLSTNQVAAVLVAGDTLYAGTSLGLSIIGLKPDSAVENAKTLLSSQSISCLDRADDALWIGTSAGAYRLEMNTAKLSVLSAPEISDKDQIYAITHSPGAIWIASENNLISINLQTAQIVSYPEVNSYGGARAIAICDSTLAVATQNGLLLYTLGAKIRHQRFTKDDGLLSLNLKRVVFDGDYLWIGSDRGLSRFWYKNPALMR